MELDYPVRVQFWSMVSRMEYILCLIIELIAIDQYHRSDPPSDTPILRSLGRGRCWVQSRDNHSYRCNSACDRFCSCSHVAQTQTSELFSLPTGLFQNYTIYKAYLPVPRISGSSNIPMAVYITIPFSSRPASEVNSKYNTSILQRPSIQSEIHSQWNNKYRSNFICLYNYFGN